MSQHRQRANGLKRENTAAVKAFFNHWRVYRKVVRHNYTAHRQMYAVLHRFLRAHFNRPFSLLDFGCGDAGFMARALRDTRIDHYQGVDLSPIALRLARRNMVGLRCQQVFSNSDFFGIAEKRQRRADVIWIGLSLHHLRRRQKDALLRDSRRILGATGYLMIFDPVRRAGESRAAFVKRWWSVCRRRWTTLSSAEARDIHAHVAAADFPESLAVYRRLATRHGFRKVQCLCREPTGIYQLICFHV